MDFSIQISALKHIQLITYMVYIWLGGFMITFGKQNGFQETNNRGVAKLPALVDSK